MYRYMPEDNEDIEASLIKQYPDYLDRKKTFLRWQENYSSKKVQLIAKTNQEIAANIDTICVKYDIYSVLRLNGHLLKYCKSDTFETLRHYIFRPSLIQFFPLAFQYAPESIRSDFYIAFSVVKDHPIALQFVSKSLKQDKQFIECIWNIWHIPSSFLDESMLDQFPYCEYLINRYDQCRSTDYDPNCIFDPYEDNEDEIYQILLKSVANARNIFSHKILFDPSPAFVQLLQDMPHIWRCYEIQRRIVRHISSQTI